MILDEPEQLYSKPKLHPLQKITLSIEIALAAFFTLGSLFKIMSYPFANEILIVAMTSLTMLYLTVPIFLFRGKKVVDHLLSHLVGLVLAISIFSALFRIMSWPYGGEMHLLAVFLSLPLTLILLVFLISYGKKEEKRGFYSRVILRMLIILVLFIF